MWRSGKEYCLLCGWPGFDTSRCIRWEDIFPLFCFVLFFFSCNLVYFKPWPDKKKKKKHKKKILKKKFAQKWIGVKIHLPTSVTLKVQSLFLASDWPLTLAEWQTAVMEAFERTECIIDQSVNQSFIFTRYLRELKKNRMYINGVLKNLLSNFSKKSLKKYFCL